MYFKLFELQNRRKIFGEGNAVGKALEGMARQPEVSDTLRTNMILGCAITESTGIYSLVIALLLLFVF